MKPYSDMAKLIRVISSAIPCYKCPFPCGRPSSSIYSCDRHWYTILANLDTSKSWDEIKDEVYALYEVELSKEDINSLLKMVSSDFPCVLVCKENWSRDDYR